MDGHSIRLVLGSPSQLPSSVEPLQVLLATSFGAVGVLAAAELRARSDNLLSCKLQAYNLSDAGARSGLARALFIITDPIAYISLAPLSVYNSFSALPQVPLVEGGINEVRSPRNLFIWIIIGSQVVLGLANVHVDAVLW